MQRLYLKIKVLLGSSDMEFGHRARSNTAQRLEKMDQERKKAAKVKHVKWDQNPGNISLAEQSELFRRKDFRKKDTKVVKRHSLLAEQLEKSPHPPENPFTEYAKFDGNVRTLYVTSNLKFDKIL